MQRSLSSSIPGPIVGRMSSSVAWAHLQRPMVRQAVSISIMHGKPQVWHLGGLIINITWAGHRLHISGTRYLSGWQSITIILPK